MKGQLDPKIHSELGSKETFLKLIMQIYIVLFSDVMGQNHTGTNRNIVDLMTSRFGFPWPLQLLTYAYVSCYSSQTSPLPPHVLLGFFNF